MTLAQRLGLAAKAAVGIFSDTAARDVASLLIGVNPGSVGPPPTRGTRERIGAYADMPWLHAVADKVAAAFASVDWTLYAVKPRGAERAQRMKTIQRAGFIERHAAMARLKAAGELVPIDDPSHPFYQIMGGGNSFMTGVDLRKLTMLYYDLEGDVFWLKERNGLGVPIGAWPIPPDWIMSMPTFQDRRFRVAFRGWQGWIPDTEVTWFSSHNPSNPYGRGTGQARALADELETDEYAARFVRTTFFNQARPDFMIYPKGGQSLTETERRRLEYDWNSQHQGFWRAFRGRFASREVGVHEFASHDFRHLQMIQLRKHERDTIIQVWGVPLSLLGIIEPGHSRATLAGERHVFARWVLVPRLEAFRAMLQERLIPEYDDRLIVDYTSPVEEDKDFQLEAAKAMPAALRVDEWREFSGRPPLPAESGQGFLVPFNLTPMADLGSVPVPEQTLPPNPDPAQRARRMIAARAGMSAEDVAAMSTDELLTLQRLYARDSRW